MIRVAIVQTAYIPWRGFFDLIDDVDIFLLFDDVEYSDGSWRNRNKIKTEYGSKWLSIPIKKGHKSKLICDVESANNDSWKADHLNKLKVAYSKAPFFDVYFPQIVSLYSELPPSLSKLNEKLIRWIMKELRIDTKVLSTVGLGATGVKTDRVISVLKSVDAECYLSGPVAKDYLDEGAFAQSGISLEYKAYSYNPYPQLWGEYDQYLTILDMLFNLGDDARDYLKSTEKNQRVI